MSILDERLERLVTTTESYTRMIGSLATVTEENTRQISDLRSSIASLVNVAEQHQQSLEPECLTHLVALAQTVHRIVLSRENQIWS